MAVFVLLFMAIASLGGVLFGMQMVPSRNTAYALLFFYLIPVATLIGFGGAIKLMGGIHRRREWSPIRAIFWAFFLSFILGAGLVLMTRL